MASFDEANIALCRKAVSLASRVVNLRDQLLQVYTLYESAPDGAGTGGALKGGFTTIAEEVANGGSIPDGESTESKLLVIPELQHMDKPQMNQFSDACLTIATAVDSDIGQIRKTVLPG